MKRMIKECISHLSVIWAMMLLTFWVTDRFNTAMAFINHPMTKGLLLVFALSITAIAILLLTHRKNSLTPLQVGMAIPTLLIAAGLMVLLMADYFAPKLLLFVSEIVKGYLLGTILCGLAIAIFGIWLYRKEPAQ